jgi:hypothetical protein
MVHRLYFYFRKIGFILLPLGILFVEGGVQKSLQAGVVKQSTEPKVATGKVVDQKGNPVSGYPVKLKSISQLHGKEEFIAITNSSGEFNLLNLPAGAYEVNGVNQPDEQMKTIEVKGKAKETIERLTIDSP